MSALITQTAAQLADFVSWSRPDTVLVASGGGFADALGASAAASAFGAPLLLSLPTCMPTPTLDALDRLTLRSVALVGGRAALSDAVAAYQPC